MKFLVKTLSIAGAGLLLGGNVWAAVPEKYQTILDRNAFGLLPPPPPPEETKVEAPPLNLFLTGFATIGGERRAYFVVPPSKEPGAVQQYLTLSEGQREGSLEILSISEAEGEVRIREGKLDRVLNLKENGIQPAKLAPGMKPGPMPIGPAPNMQAGSPVYSPVSAGSAAAQNQQQRSNGSMQPPQPGRPGSAQGTSAPPAIRTIPTRTLRVPPVQQSSGPGPQSAIDGGNPVVYDPYPNNNDNNNNNSVDPAVQIALMKEYQAEADRNGGVIPIVTRNTEVNPVVAQPPTRTHYVPAPPMPPLPQ